MTFTILVYSSVISLGQVCRGVWQPNTIQMQNAIPSPKSGQTLEPGAYWVNFSRKSRQQGHLTVDQTIKLNRETTFVTQLLRLGIKCKLCNRQNKGKSRPVSKTQALIAFWDNTTSDCSFVVAYSSKTSHLPTIPTVGTKYWRFSFRDHSINIMVPFFSKESD